MCELYLVPQSVSVDVKFAKIIKLHLTFNLVLNELVYLFSFLKNIYSINSKSICKNLYLVTYVSVAAEFAKIIKCILVLAHSPCS